MIQMLSEDMGKTGPLAHCWWEYKVFTGTLGKEWQFLTKCGYIFGHLPQRNCNFCSHKILYINTHSICIGNSKKTGNNLDVLQWVNG